MRLLVTGSSGFVGHRLVEHSSLLGWDTLRHSRKEVLNEPGVSFICDIDKNTNWMPMLNDIDCIVHCAARVHQMDESPENAQKAYDAVNVEGTLNLARQAVDASVKRFVFISSIKVNGEYTESGFSFTQEVKSEPTDCYSISKYQAEQKLKELAEQTGLELVIIRPPLVYGPGVKANFLSMMYWIKKGIPLPLGAIKNRRSLVFIDNLVDLICVCCSHPKAPGHVFLVSDDHDVSVTYLLKSIAQAMNARSYLIPIPEAILTFGLTVMGKKTIAQRLCSSLQLDISETKDILDWTPPCSFEAGINATVNAYLKERDL